jgi:hypothetical protein
VCIVLVMLHMYVKISEFWVQNFVLLYVYHGASVCCSVLLLTTLHDVNSIVLRICYVKTRCLVQL